MIHLAAALAPWLGLLAVAAPGGARRAHAILVVVAAATAGLAIAGAGAADEVLAGGYLRVDATSRLFAPVIDVIFFGVAVHLWTRAGGAAALVGTPARRRRRVMLILAFGGACNAVLLGNDLMVMWLALEVSTLAAAPLIVRLDDPASRGASWRYLLFSTVALGLVLVGLGCVTRSVHAAGLEPSLRLDELPGLLAGPPDAWRQLGVGLIVLGLATKLGLAPMYSWLPDAYERAPSSITALLGAVQFNAALIVLLRVVHVFRSGSGALLGGELVTLGLLSMVASTASLIATRDVKRLLAYASINHGGVIAIGLGLHREAAYGVLLYAMSNAFIKAILFLTAEKIELRCGTRDARAIAGLIKDLPYSGVFLMVGTFALLGLPPFSSFLGELLILSALVASDELLVFAAFCVLITMSFVATGRTIFPMIWGQAPTDRSPARQSALAALPKLVFLLVLIVLGIYVPAPINDLILSVAATLEGG